MPFWKSIILSTTLLAAPLVLPARADALILPLPAGHIIYHADQAGQADAQPDTLIQSAAQDSTRKARPSQVRERVYKNLTPAQIDSINTLTRRHLEQQLIEFDDVETVVERKHETAMPAALDPKRQELAVEGLYGGSAARALQSQPSVTRPASNLIAYVLVDGIPLDDKGSYRIGKGKISMYGPFYSGQGLNGGFLDSPLLEHLAIENTGYGVSHEGIMGVAHADVAHDRESPASAMISMNLLKQTGMGRIPIKEIKGDLSLAISRDMPLWPIDQIPGTEYFPRTTFWQGTAGALNGNLNVAGFLANESQHVKDGSQGVSLDQSETHSLVMADYTITARTWFTTASASNEYWNNKQNIIEQSSDRDNTVRLGIIATSFNVESGTSTMQVPDGRANLRFAYTRIRNSSSKPLPTLDDITDAYFNRTVGTLPPELQPILTQRYNDIPEGQRYATVKAALLRAGALYQEHTGKDPQGIAEYKAAIDALNQLPGQIPVNAPPPGVDVMRLSAESRMNLTGESSDAHGTVLASSAGITKLRDQYIPLYSLSLTFAGASRELTVSHGHYGSFIERNNLETLFDNARRTRQTSWHEAVTFTNHFESPFIEKAYIQLFRKDYYFDENEHGFTTGINVSVGEARSEARFAYLISGAFGTSRLDGDRVTGAIDKNVNFTGMMRITAGWYVSMTWRYQDGMWTDRTLDRAFAQLPPTVSLDIASTGEFDFFGMRASYAVGVYDVLQRKNPMFQVIDGNGAVRYITMPTTGTLEMKISF